jgi:hypothetical protein
VLATLPARYRTSSERREALSRIDGSDQAPGSTAQMLHR